MYRHNIFVSFWLVGLNQVIGWLRLEHTTNTIRCSYLDSRLKHANELIRWAQISSLGLTEKGFKPTFASSAACKQYSYATACSLGSDESGMLSSNSIWGYNSLRVRASSNKQLSASKKATNLDLGLDQRSFELIAVCTWTASTTTALQLTTNRWHYGEPNLINLWSNSANSLRSQTLSILNAQ